MTVFYLEFYTMSATNICHNNDKKLYFNHKL